MLFYWQFKENDLEFKLFQQHVFPYLNSFVRLPHVKNMTKALV